MKRFLLGAVMIGSATTPSLASPHLYSIKELGAAQFVIDLNNNGELLTWAGNDSAPTYLYEKSGEVVDLAELPLLPATCKYSTSAGPLYVGAAALNDLGFVLLNVFGPQSEDPGRDCLVLYHQGSLHYQATLGTNAFATDFNNRNQIIGNLIEPLNTVVGFGPGCNFIWSGMAITADAINDRGEIAGTSADGAELCTDGVWHLLPTFSGESPPISAASINDRGDIVGTASFSVDPSTQVSHSFLYSDGKTHDLGTVPGSPKGSIYAEKINAKGQIVGVAYTESGSTTFLYEDGVMYDLMTLINGGDPLRTVVQLEGGSVINDDGVIASNGTDLRTGVTHVYLLTPLPGHQ